MTDTTTVDTDKLRAILDPYKITIYRSSLEAVIELLARPSSRLAEASEQGDYPYLAGFYQARVEMALDSLTRMLSADYNAPDGEFA